MADDSKMAVIGFGLGVVGVVAWLLPVAGAPIGIAGLLLSIKGLQSQQRRLAIAGTALCSIGIVLTVVRWVIGASRSFGG